MFAQLREFGNEVSAEAGHVLWRFRNVLIWLTPLVVAFLAHRFSEHRQVTIVGAVIALFAFVYLVQRPGIALIALAAFLPLQGVGFGLLLGLHVPASTLHEASGLKELLGVSLLGAAIRRLRDGEQVLDRIDKAILAYVAVVTVYLIIPHLFSPTAPSSFSPRIVSWRADCGYPLLFLAVRHAGISEGYKKRFVQVVLAMGGIIVLGGLYQRIAPHSWAHFMLIRAKQPQFLIDVNHLQPLAAQQTLHFLANPSPLQVSSIFVSPYDMADYLLLVVGITAALIIRDRRSVWNWLLLGGTVAVLFFSRVRADSLGALLVLGVAVLPAPRRPVEARVRLILGLVIGAAIIVPSLGGTRFVGAQGGSQSNHGHVGEFIHGISVAVAHPLGLGIGDQAATATKYQAETGLPPSTLLSSGSIAQVSDELGIQALIPWLLIMGFIFYELRRRARGPDDLVTGVGLGLLGLFLAAEFHHAFITYPGPWTMFAAIGLALPGARPAASTVTPDRHPVRVTV